ncbi:hypothetical protein ACHAQH_009294 [Verticillium albo-atrum]
MKTTRALAAFAGLPLIAAYCPPTGAVLPNPKINSSNNFTAILRESLERVVKSCQNDFNVTTTSFSVEITTAEETFFEFHHTAPLRNDTGVDEVNGETIYRIGSVTKVFTVLSLLLEDGLNLDLPVWQFVSELEGVAKYKDTTLRMLASQLAGVNKDGFVYDLSATLPPLMLAQLGLPKIPIPEGLPTCDAIQIGEAPCTRGGKFTVLSYPSLMQQILTLAEFFDGLKFSNLTWHPGTNAAYSNLAYIILGFAIDNITSSSYADALQDRIAAPLQLNNTGTQVPPVENGIIPIGGGAQWYTQPLVNYDSTGGMFSTPNDLQSFIRSVLTHKQLSRADTDMWLKPVVFTATPGDAVGMPWEIYRPEGLTPDGRPIEMYTKTGNVPFYAAHIAFLPAYGVGISINTAGEQAFPAVMDLLDVVVRGLIPSLEALTRSQAEAVYAGTYKSETGSLTLTVDDGPGLKIDEWTLGKGSILDAWLGFPGRENLVSVDARAYPTGEDDRWLVYFEGQPAKNKTGIFAKQCETWLTQDGLRFSGLPIDEIDFKFEGEKVVGAVSPGLRQEMVKA